ncbi:lysylphosphatidylglycerol synthase domain-containing protein [Brachybacterium sp. YJGR34]|uniref:lysylphosphatidylglycerol synthase domain-containing protein n=1 Tax=Brachybacterium sp. YJGR34 TaxID=2059911 RepID=UPI0018E5F2AE|nr:lysylphosphatidylglycerol synthase domain-containing protein [Brachybacterium sp. YJGR34]
MSAPRHGSPTTPDPDSEDGTGAAEDVQGWLPGDLGALDGEAPPRFSAGKLAGGALSLLLVAALLAWVLPWASGASWPRILTTLAALPPWALPAMVLLGVAALLLEALTVRTAVTGSRYSSALLGHAASSATSLAVPGGGILGLGLMAWILRRTGLALAVILTGIIAASLVEMVLTSVLVPLLGLGAYALSAWLSPTAVQLPGALWAAAAALLGSVLALVLTAVLLRRSVLAGLLAQLGGAVPEHVARAILVQRDALVRMLRSRHFALVLPTLVARVLQWLALVLAVHAVGAEIPLLLSIAIFALGRVLSLVPLTPGGAGITETVGAAALVALGVGAPEAAAAMLLLLVTMLVVPLLAGAGATALAVLATPDRRRRT